TELANWNVKEYWAVSTTPGGTPGGYEMLIPAKSIVINEVLAHSHNTLPDWIELHNTSNINIDIGGWYLSDSATKLQKYQIPSGVVVPAQGYVVFNETEHFGGYFGLSENGEVVYLSSAIGGVLTGYQESEDFGASATGVSFGRYQKSDGSYNFVSMSGVTPGEANALPLVGPLVITEIMYNPLGNGDAEYIEIANISSEPVNMWYEDTNTAEIIPWRILDESGVMLEFPLGVTMLAGEKILLVYDINDYIDEFGQMPYGTQYYQWTTGKLSNSGEKLELQMPGDTDGLVRYFIRVDRVNYDDSDPWPTTPDGDGDSLNRINPDLYGNDSINWSAEDPTPGE
ncbi:MAG: lamin tail domain-containing protein, partial [Bacteroidales bacterium]|nr:lamin tail domain-containing protein [Bacteroidales bacterium]